jgi:hypothetical protein
MKKIFALALGAVLLTGAAFKAKDALGDLGLTEDQVKHTVFQNFMSDYLSYDITSRVRTMARKIPAGSQAAAVRALGSVVRAYVESEEFRQRYTDHIEQTYKVDGPTSEEEIRSRRAEYDQATKAQMEAATMAFSGLENIPDNMVPMMIQSMLQSQEAELSGAEGARKAKLQKDIAELKKLQAKAATQPKEVRKAMIAMMTGQLSGGLEEGKAKADQEQAEAMKNLEVTKKQLALREANRDYNKVLKERLRAFIELSGTVDFDAKLKKSGYRMYFENAAYEQKPDNWKFLYRIGREPATAAREFAVAWLKDLESKAKRG